MIICFDEIFTESCTALPGLVHLDRLDAVRPEHMEETIGLVVRLGVTLDRAVLQSLPRLRFVATITTGLDHIDTDYCLARGIDILSLKGERQFLESIRATPEHTFALMLALIRRIPNAVASVRRNQWDRQSFYGEELCDKVLGVVGYGRVGQRLAHYAKAFGMRVLAFDKTPNQTADDVQFVDLDTLCAKSDIISINLSFSEETRNFIARSEFAAMRRRPWIINTARGGIINDEALIEALSSDLIKGAALDVLSTELEFSLNKAESPLIEMSKTYPNLIITPHIAGSTHESMQRTASFIEKKIMDYLSK